MPAAPSPALTTVHPVADGAAILLALRALSPQAGDVIAFDADGTLWSGDVAEDLFDAAVAGNLFREEAHPALQALLRTFGQDAEGSTAALAARVDSAYRQGVLPEPDAYGMMVWAYAGYTEAALVALATDTLRRAGLPTLVRPAVPEVLAYAREVGLRILVVSASPRQVVRAGLDLCGLQVDGLVGAEARVVDGRVEAGLAGPLPYGPQKVVQARAQVGNARWLASFGDSAFDFALLAEAELAVAVGPKPSLRGRLGELPRSVLLYEP